MPLFSVVVPMYNVEEYAKRCIESVLLQTYKDFELILVDDGSKDSTSRIIDEYAAKDVRIRVIHKENGGLVSARKVGASTACGEYIVPLDGDDWLHNESLQRFADIIKAKQGVDILVSKLFYITDDGKCEEHKSRLPVGIMDKKKLDRINALAKKSREEGLTEEEKLEQKKLREEYIAEYRRGLEMQLENMYVLDKDGNERKLGKKN